ncbi:hypothetical protein B0H12DRAFT_1231608 [Mycena haematopus]|nr:hypothetical protein B0H12DRAFT_1231608 [Mycena haematopus]
MDIAWSLGLDDTGTKAVLLDRIDTYFTNHSAERESEKYRGLFVRAARGRRAAAPAPANDTPQPSTSAAPSSSALHNLTLHSNGDTNNQNTNHNFTFTASTIQPQYSSTNPPPFQYPFAAPHIPYGVTFPPETNPYLHTFDSQFNTYSDFNNVS